MNRSRSTNSPDWAHTSESLSLAGSWSHSTQLHSQTATAQPGEPPTAPQARRGKAAQRKLYLRARITARRWVRYVGCQAPNLTHPPVGGHLSPVPAPSDTGRTHPPQKFESPRSPTVPDAVDLMAAKASPPQRERGVGAGQMRASEACDDIRYVSTTGCDPWVLAIAQRSSARQSTDTGGFGPMGSCRSSRASRRLHSSN